MAPLGSQAVAAVVHAEQDRDRETKPDDSLVDIPEADARPASRTSNRQRLDSTDNPNGYEIDVEPDMLQGAIVSLLFGQVKQDSGWFIQLEQRMQLLVFRSLFNELRAQTKHKVPKSHGEVIPFEAFQRAFERLFYVLGDPVEFVGEVYDANSDGYVSWQEFFCVYKRRRITIRLNLCERIYLTLESPETSRMAHLVSVAVLSLILVSSLCFILSTVPECKIDPDSCLTFSAIEEGCLFLFLLEYALRIGTCWNVRHEIFDKKALIQMAIGYQPIKLPSPARRLFDFVKALSNLIDLAAILPGAVQLIAPETNGGVFVVLRLVRLTRIFRAFKSPTLVEPVVVMTRTIVQSTKALYVLAFNLVLGIVIFGSLMYMAEGGKDMNAFGVGGKWSDDEMVYLRYNGREWVGNATHGSFQDSKESTPFQSIPHTFWWAIVTAVTVGYGDRLPSQGGFHPKTSLGYAIASALMLWSLVILALPVGVIGGTFSTVWTEYAKERKKEELALQRDIRLITSEIARLDPWSLSQTMMIEVWHDHPGLSQERPPPAYFLGQATFTLELDRDRPVTKTVEATLLDNKAIKGRKIQGKVTVKYDWIPDSTSTPVGDDLCDGKMWQRGASGGSNRESNDKEEQHESLRGTLEVTVLSAKGLTNLGSLGRRERSATNAFCVVLAFSALHNQEEGPTPCAWRTPTCLNSCNPKWSISHRFRYDWCQADPNSWDPPSEIREMNHSEMNRSERGEASHGLQDLRQAARVSSHPHRHGSERGSERDAVEANPPVEESPKLLQFLSLLKEASHEMKQHRAELKSMNEDVRALNGRVDQLAKRKTSLHKPQG